MTLTDDEWGLIRKAHDLIHKLVSQGSGRLGMDGGAEVLTFGDCELSVGERRLRRRRRVVALTLQEFQLLHCLVAHPGRALSRMDLCQLAWGREWDGGRSLDTFVSVLRRKIERGPRQPRMIHCVCGFGYRFEAIREGHSNG